jgi:hypothetical protein
MTNVGIVISSRSVPLPRTNRRVLSLELEVSNSSTNPLALEKRTSRDMSLRKLRQKSVSSVSLMYMKRHTFTQNEIKRDKNEIVGHFIVLYGLLVPA